jgi:hypothetical protein
VVDASGVAPVIEAALPKGVRQRQLCARTWLIGMLLCLADGRPAHLSRAHEALIGLPEADRARLGVMGAWKSGPHLLTYRQIWHTSAVVFAVLGKAGPDGEPSALLQGLADALLEASTPAWVAKLSTSLAVDWTDAESFARPPVPGLRPSADTEASWGHRKGTGPGEKDELFYGYYLSAGTMVQDDDGPPVPELVRRATLTACHVDPVPAFVPVLEAMTVSGTPLGDVVADSGYAHRWAVIGRCRSGAWGRTWSWTCTQTTEGREALSPALFVATATCTARRCRRGFWAWALWPGAHPPSSWRRTTKRPQN